MKKTFVERSAAGFLIGAIDDMPNPLPGDYAWSFKIPLLAAAN